MPSKTFSKSFFLDSGPQAQLRFAGPRATSNWVVLPVIGFLSLNASTVSADDTLEIFLQRVLADICAFFVAWMLFAALGAVITKVAPTYGWPRMLGLVLLYALTEMSRTTTGYLVTIAQGIPENPDWAFRLSSAATTGLIFFGISSTLVNDGDIYRRGYRELATVRMRLEAVLATSKSTLVNTREQVIERIRKQLNVALRESIAESQSENPRITLMTTNLFDAVERVVRPVSRELFSKPAAYEEASSSVVPPKIRMRQVFSQAIANVPLKPGVYVALIWMLTAPFVFFKSSTPVLFGTFVIASIVSYAILSISAWVLRVWHTSIPFALAVTQVTLTYWVMGAVFAATVMAALGTPANGIFLMALYGGGLSAILGWLLALITGMHEARQEMLSEVIQANDELSWQVARIQSEIWADQKRLAVTLHNSVQGLLLAAALRLSDNGDSEQRAMNVAQAQALVQQAVDFEFGSQDTSSFQRICDALENSWGGIVTLSCDVGAEDRSLIDQDPVLLRAIEDIVTEFVTNAVKHGKASEVRLWLRAQDDRNVELLMLNDGIPRALSATEGMGTAFMNSVSIVSEALDPESGFGIRLLLPTSASL